MVADLGEEALTPVRFCGFLNNLRATLAEVGRDAVKRALESMDEPRPSVHVDGQALRYRGKSEREWLSPFGKMKLKRRCYRGDGPDAGSSFPLDEACGMRDRFMTPDVEEMVAYSSALLTATEVEQLIAKTLPEGPSSTAVQNAVRRIGGEIDKHRATIEDSITKTDGLSSDGDVLVASWDGVMTPMREKGVAWREAGVATVSVYGQGTNGPEKLDTRFLARMPEEGMKTLVASVADQVERAKANHEYRAVVVLCDGKKDIWNAASRHPALQDCVSILDFYHASENLMKAAKAIFGDTDRATRWHKKIRDKLILDERGVDNAIRSMCRYRTALAIGSQQRKVVSNAIAYFRLHRDRMRYASFISRGLPIGSGPVEAAAKNIVQARLKRSGMRWTREGGQHVLDLRSYLKSGRWETMWSTLKAAA